MSPFRSRTVILGVVCAASVMMVSASVAAATTPPEDTTDTTGTEVGGVEILPPDELWGGANRGEWDARWWQWAASMPEEVNPNFDTTVGERCGFGQSGPVFFLPGSFSFEPNEPGFTCVVAEGTAIYVGLIGSECSTVEPPPFFGRDEVELRTCAAAATDAVLEASATVNGQDVGDLGAYRTSSPLFTLTFPENNIFGVEPGVAQAVSDGYSFIIAPPPPGEYEFTGSFTFTGEPEPFVSTITIVVQAPQVIEPPASTEPPATEPAETSAATSPALTETTEPAPAPPLSTPETTEPVPAPPETTEAADTTIALPPDVSSPPG